MRGMILLLAICLLLNVVGCNTYTPAFAESGIVLIDPGHGGFDGGTIAEDGTLEKHLNLAVATDLHDLLYVCGVSVIMTRQTDQGLEEDGSASIRNKKVSDMHRRLALYNSADLVISIHHNYFTSSKYSGAQLFYSPNCQASSALAEDFRQSVVEWVQPQNTRQSKAATEAIYLLYHATSPAVLVECGFLSNPEELHRLKQPAYQQQLAFALAVGYWNYQERT